MSRIGKQPITLPRDVKVRFDAPVISVQGPRGSLQHTVPAEIELEIGAEAINVRRTNDERTARSLHGLTRTLIANMVEGVTKGFTKELEVVGVGYRAEKAGATLKMSLGYSHQIGFDEPQGITISVDKQVIRVAGIDKCLVGQTAAKIKRFKKPDVYKGKGIRYVGEVVRKKAGKAGSK
jgi:large subunit ribosomal protein L6